MATETLLMKSLSKGDLNLNYGNYANSSELLSKWFNSLEARSSLFWLHYLNCNFIDEEEDENDRRPTIEEVKRPDLTVEDEDGSVNSDSLGVKIDEDNDDYDATEFPIVSCNSIAHRDTELLVALTENCTHRPVCYFCR